jgi:hypothetical protein
MTTTTLAADGKWQGVAWAFMDWRNSKEWIASWRREARAVKAGS